MGGHALKKVVTRRYNRDEYLALKEKILQKIHLDIPNAATPREFPSKESFGDLDVLMVCPPTIRMREFITKTFQPNEIVQNGTVYSFDVEEFQVDFILIPADQYENAVVYFSYSDLGGLIGNVCHKIGLKYGMQGLWMNVHTKEFDPTTTSTQLILSRNVEQIFAFLGYDYEKYQKGFANPTEFFQWLIEGKYFRRLYFDENQLNHAHRHRTAKRPIYLQFVEFLNEHNIDGKEFVGSEEELLRDVRRQALTFFNKQSEYDQGLQVREDRKSLKDKYNGAMFLDVAETRQMIKTLKEKFERRIAPTDEEFQQWVHQTDAETIQREIDLFKAELRK